MGHKQKKELFLTTYDVHSTAIFRFCALKVSNRELAEDITQEVFMRYWQALRKGDSIQNDRAYLYRIARNLVIDWYRKKKEISLDVMLDAGIEFKDNNQAGIAEQAELQEVLRVIKKLDQASQDILLLRFMEGFSPQEIAFILKESPNVVSVRLHRAIKKVQELIHAHD